MAYDEKQRKLLRDCWHDILLTTIQSLGTVSDSFPMIKSGSHHERNDGWKNPDKMAGIKPPPLQAPPIAKLAKPCSPPSSLSAPQPNEAGIAKPLCAPQPFSNAPKADIDGTQGRRPRTRRVPRTIIISTSSSKDRKKSRRRRKQRSSKRVHGDQKLRSCSRSREPENDIGARPLESNAKRDTTIFASIVEERSKDPCIEVAMAGSTSTARTVSTSFDHSVLSSKAPPNYTADTSHSGHHVEMVRRKPYPKKSRQRSKASISSFTGDVLSTSGTTRMASSADTSTRFSLSERSRTITEGRHSSSTSYSMGIRNHDSRELTGEVSIVGSVVDETQLEAESVDRIKSRIDEAVEDRPFIGGDEENPQAINTESCTHSQSNSDDGDFLHETSNSIYESASHAKIQGSDTQETMRAKATPSKLSGGVHVTRKNQKISCFIAWTGLLVLISSLVVLVVFVLRLDD